MKSLIHSITVVTCSIHPNSPFTQYQILRILPWVPQIPRKPRTQN